MRAETPPKSPTTSEEVLLLANECKTTMRLTQKGGIGSHAIFRH